MASRKAAGSVVLFVDGGRAGEPYRIVNRTGKSYSKEEARRLWDAGKVADCNMAFQRLATRAGWDFEELRRQYDQMDRARGPAR